MPTFDFRCGKCDATFEVTLPFGSSKRPTCPSCGSKATEKMIAPPGIVFKGSGWYKTDSRPTPPGGTPPPAKKPAEQEGKKSDPTSPEASRGKDTPTAKKDAPKKEAP